MRRRLFSALAVAGVAGSVHTVRAEQLVIADVTYTHSAETTSDSHYYVPPLPGTPADWTSPVDWTKGSVHLRLEVKTKPTATPTRYQVCFDVKPNYGCTWQIEPYTTTGVYDLTTPFASIWYPTPEFDWSQGVRVLSLILKDVDNNKPQGDPLYVPTELRVEVTLLSEGAVYVPPPRPDGGTTPSPEAGVEAGTPPDSGVPPPDARAPSADAAPPRDSSVEPPPDAEAPPPNEPGDAALPPPPPRDGGPRPGHPSAPDSSVEGGNPMTLGGRGCSAASGTAPPASRGAAGLALVAGVFLAARRRLRQRFPCSGRSRGAH